jgi:hypothetical protein
MMRWNYISNINKDDKQSCWREANEREKYFASVVFPQLHLPWRWNPAKDSNPWLLDYVHTDHSDRFADLKWQEEPRYLPPERLDPQWTFTFDRDIFFSEGFAKEYRKHNPLLLLVIQIPEVKCQFGRTVQPMQGIWQARYSDVGQWIENTNLLSDELENRLSGNKTAKHYLDLRWSVFQQIYLEM